MSSPFEFLVTLGCCQQLVLLFLSHLESLLLFVLQGFEEFFILYSPLLDHGLLLRGLALLFLQLGLTLKEVIHHQILLLLLLFLFALLLFSVFLFFCLLILEILEYFRPNDDIFEVQPLYIFYIELMFL